MATFSQSGEERRSQFVQADLRGARFIGSDLSGAVMRAVAIGGAEIDSPWLLEEPDTLLVNGVDVAPLVDAELNRRFPGRETRRANDPAGLRDAWEKLQATWGATLARVERMPAGTVDRSVAGEWSFAQTLRHLIMATDTWLRGSILRIDRPFHPIGQPHSEYESDGYDMSVFSTERPSYQQVLAVRAERVGMVRDFLADVTPQLLDEERPNPWAPDYPETVRRCLRTILEEEWEHHRYAVRDLDAIAAGQADA